MSQRTAIFTIEALRSGIPTRESTRVLPDIRPAISKRFSEDLASFDSDTVAKGRILWGQYGQGKTHELTLLEHQALDSHFAVSRVSLSRETSCHNMMQFYAHVVSRIRTPHSTLNGLQQYLNQLQLDEIKKSRIFNEQRYCNALPVQVLEDYFLADGESKEQLYGDLMGTRLPLAEVGRIHRSVTGQRQPKFGFKMSQDAPAYFGLMADLIQLCGFEGWVILLDELELLGRLGRVSRYKAYRNLAWLLNWNNQMHYPIYTVAAAATRLQDDTWYGKANDDRTIMPELARGRDGDEAALDMQRFFDKAIGADSLNVTPAKEQNLLAVLECIAALHGEAYAWPARLDARKLISLLGSQPVRVYLRAALEQLDRLYLYGDEELPSVRGLEEGVLVAELSDLVDDEPASEDINC